jgi:hypothetical protein
MQYGTSGYPLPMLKGITDIGFTGFRPGSYCIPNFFLDGARFLVDGDLRPHGGTSDQPQHPFSDLSDSVRPEAIKGIEVYANPGTIPAQFDMMSSTGCGSIVIWTH